MLSHVSGGNKTKISMMSLLIDTAHFKEDFSHPILAAIMNLAFFDFTFFDTNSLIFQTNVEKCSNVTHFSGYFDLPVVFRQSR